MVASERRMCVQQENLVQFTGDRRRGGGGKWRGELEEGEVIRRGGGEGGGVEIGG